MQKDYVKFDGAGEYGAVYLWESETDLNEYRKSGLFRTIPSASQLQGPPDVQTAELVMPLRP